MSQVITNESTTIETPGTGAPDAAPTATADIDLRDDLAAVRGVFCGVMLSVPLWISAAAAMRWARNHTH
jgi:hypothetical protein